MAARKTRRKRVSRAPGVRARRTTAKKAKNPGVKMRKGTPKRWLKVKAVRVVTRGGRKILEVKR